MDQAENLRTIAQVATAFAGFTGVVIILGHRSTGTWSAAEKSTIRILLETSIGTVFLALIPPIITSSFSSPVIAWRLSSGLLTAYHLAILLRSDVWDRRQSGDVLGRKLDWGLSVVGVISICATALVALGYALQAAALIYTLSLLFLLLIAALSFGALLLSGSKSAA